MNTAKLEMPCLGRPFHLGTLYDCRTNCSIHGFTLWDPETLNEHVAQENQETSHFEVIVSDSLNNKANLFDVDPGLKLSMLSGLVKVKGAALFLKDQKSSKHLARVSLRYTSTSIYKHLTFNIKQLERVEHKEICNATHVATAILYGIDVILVFECEVSKNESSKEIQAKLKSKVGFLSDLANQHAEGKFSLHECVTEDTSLKILTCKFFGEGLALPKSPVTFEDAVKLCQDLPGLAKENRGTPKKVWLYPLVELNFKVQNFVPEIDRNLADEVVVAMEVLSNCYMQCNDLSTSDACSSLFGIKEQLENTKQDIVRYRVQLKTNVSMLLPKLQDDKALENLLDEHNKSFFCKEKLEKWIASIDYELQLFKKQIDYLKKQLQQQVQFLFEPGKLGILVGDLEVDTVLCFDFNIVVDKTMTSHNDNSSCRWYNDQSVMSRLRRQIGLFCEFVKANTDQKKSRNMKYVVVNGSSSISSSSDSVTVVSLYEKGVSSEFLIPSQPGKPKAVKVTSTSIQLTWDKPEIEAKSVKSYTVVYARRQDTAANSFGPWLEKSTLGCKEELTLSNLSPDTIYLVKVKGITVCGVTPYSPISEHIKLRLSREGRILNEILPECTEIDAGSSHILYQLPSYELVRKDGVAKVFVGKYYPVYYPVTVVPHRVVLLIGPEKSGKTILINGIANYVMGVNWEDGVYLELVSSNSKTTDITAYIFKHRIGSPIHFELTVIDTPSFGDNKEQNEQFVSQIEQLFSDNDVIDQLHAVGLVVNATQTAITPSQQFVLTEISRITSRDVLLLTTHADSQQEPLVLTAMNNARLDYKSYFKFEICKIQLSTDCACMDQFWEMSMRSFKELFGELAKKRPWSRTLSERELVEREQLEATVEGTYPILLLELSRRNALALMNHIKTIVNVDRLSKAFNFNRKITVIVAKRMIVELPFGTYATTCSSCKITCHGLCRVTHNNELFNCMAMSKNHGTKSAVCSVCNCAWDKHQKTPYRYELKFQTECEISYTGETFIELDKLLKAFPSLMNKQRVSLNRLQEIAGNANLSSSQEEFIRHFIESEKREKHLGWEDRIRALEDIVATTKDVNLSSAEQVNTTIINHNEDYYKMLIYIDSGSLDKPS